MRLWSLHPRYLDPQGLVALWREALLAQAVLHGETRGYRKHPQLERFQDQPDPRSAIAAYLQAVHTEAQGRGYSFNGDKIKPISSAAPLQVNSGQVDYEWTHLMKKLQARSPAVYERWQHVKRPELHPLFTRKPGPVASWERA